MLNRQKELVYKCTTHVAATLSKDANGRRLLSVLAPALHNATVNATGKLLRIDTVFRFE